MTDIETGPGIEQEEVIRQIKQRFTQVRCNEVQQLLHTMANPVRFHILCALRVQQFTVTDLVGISDANLSNVSQQLKMMWISGYLKKEKKGKQVYYRLASERIEKVVGYLESLFPEASEECSCEE